MFAGTSAASAGQVAPRPPDMPANAHLGHIEVLDVMSDLLLGVGEGSPPDAFFSRLCEAICRLTSMRRAVLFRYDSARRRVRAVGAYGIELDLFADLFVTIDSVPVARQALLEDRIAEVLGTSDFNVPAFVHELFAGVRMICTPMAAAGRHVGVVLSEREAEAPPMDDDERQLLWTLGKAIAMASVAREVTAYGEQSRQLQQRIDLTREIHEGVVQRLFGVSLALSRDAPLEASSQRRCANEVHTALADLSTALQRPLGYSARPTTVSFVEELQRVRALHPHLEIRLESGSVDEVPPNLEALAQSVLIEAVRNADKHSRATLVQVALRKDEATFALEIRNDGAHVHNGGRGGVGLRVATLEALQHDGVLEYGESEPGAWQVRLVVPTGR
jgi:signal transduction histidine kinase